MKKTSHLVILLGTSILAMLGRIYGTFFAKLPKLSNYTIGDPEIDHLLSEAIQITKEKYVLSTNNISKVLVIFMIIALLLSLLNLYKKKRTYYLQLPILPITHIS